MVEALAKTVFPESTQREQDVAMGLSLGWPRRRVEAVLEGLDRWGQGVSLGEVAKGLGYREQTLRKWMQEWDLALYKSTVEASRRNRLSYKRGKYERIVALAADEVLARVEDAERRGQMASDELCRIDKQYGDRLALMEGGVTSRVGGGGIQIVVWGDPGSTIGPEAAQRPSREVASIVVGPGGSGAVSEEPPGERMGGGV
jgi:hypothetical protein